MLADAADGRPSLAFVAGESGVWKTRLLAEFMRRPGDAGTLVLAGDSTRRGRPRRGQAGPGALRPRRDRVG